MTGEQRTCPLCNGEGVTDALTCITTCDNCEGHGVVDPVDDRHGWGVGGLDDVQATELLGWTEMRHERALTGRINVFGRVEVVDEHGQVLTVSSWSVETPDFDAILRAAHCHRRFAGEPRASQREGAEGQDRKGASGASGRVRARRMAARLHLRPRPSRRDRAEPPGRPCDQRAPRGRVAAHGAVDVMVAAGAVGG